ncbi:MAG: RNA-directed DNA polymerase [Nitrospirae bacterium]|nr:RNA-directed DNA polymerase [Nitrospirota bacterium]
MLDQSFSVNNFRKIFDIENRKGIFPKYDFLNEVREITKEIKQCNVEINDKKKYIKTSDIEELRKKKDELLVKKENVLTSELQNLSEKVTTSSYNIDLKILNIPNSKPIYTVEKLPEHFFVMKQLQYNVSKAFGVKQSNRNNIVSQVKILLSDGFPKCVLRTDIEDFYESIPHDKLFERIFGDNLLTPLSKKLLKHIIDQYKLLSGNVKGIPRGIGVSAYLSELYMRNIDNAIMSLKGVTYYARYVDDIIIIFTPSTSEKDCFSEVLEDHYIGMIKEIIETKYNLLLNKSKTVFQDMTKKQDNKQINYLGYMFMVHNFKLTVWLSSKKMDKYKNRIVLAFKAFLSRYNVTEKKSRRLLLKRIRFLTTNTRLKNNKDNIMVGIYFSNRHLDDHSHIKELDDTLKEQIKKLSTTINKDIYDKIKGQLIKYSFQNGFKEKKFSPFTTKELTEIVKVWQNV